MLRTLQKREFSLPLEGIRSRAVLMVMSSYKGSAGLLVISANIQTSVKFQILLSALLLVFSFSFVSLFFPAVRGLGIFCVGKIRITKVWKHRRRCELLSGRMEPGLFTNVLFTNIWEYFAILATLLSPNLRVYHYSLKQTRAGKILRKSSPVFHCLIVAKTGAGVPFITRNNFLS